MTPTPSPKGQRIAIVGAGLAGLTLAHALQAHGHHVTVFDKSRGPGGRCATRRNVAGCFDHGAPQIQAVSTEFKAAIAQWLAQGHLSALPQDSCFIGQPVMNAWPRALADGLRLQTRTHIAAIERENNAWRLRALDGPELQAAPSGSFDTVVVTTPAEQAIPLLAAAPDLATALRETHSVPCWTVMAAWPNPLPQVDMESPPSDPWAPLAMAIHQDSRPGRLSATPAPGHGGSRWVLHAGAEWSANNLDAPSHAVATRLITALSERIGLRLARPSWFDTHCWRYAQVLTPREEPFGWNPALRLGACGDAWHHRSGAQGLERAWWSAVALAQHLRE